MLGSLLSALFTAHTQPVPDDGLDDDVYEDRHWASDDNRFEDWLLHPEMDDTADTESFY